MSHGRVLSSLSYWSAGILTPLACRARLAVGPFVLLKYRLHLKKAAVRDPVSWPSGPGKSGMFYCSRADPAKVLVLVARHEKSANSGRFGSAGDLENICITWRDNPVCAVFFPAVFADSSESGASCRREQL